MSPDLFHGQLVRLVAANSETDTDIWAGWSRNSEFQRLLDSAPANPWSRIRARAELEEEPKETLFPFNIRALADDRLIGFVGLGGLQWTHGDTWLGIGIGEPAYWGRGYGADATRLVLRFGFTELNLHRVTLGVYSYNLRAIRAYEKAGFVTEGRLRHVLHRDGQWYDEVSMGILREDWEKQNSNFQDSNSKAGR